MDKQKLRQQMLLAREALEPNAIQDAGDAICARLACWPPFQSARAILGYLAFRNEISLQALIDAHPEKVWALPITLRGGILKIHRYQPGRLVQHRFGMFEPAPDAPPVPLAAIDLVLVPGVGFDSGGRRIGYGGGYYDRLLPQLPSTALKVGIAFDDFLVPEIPCEEHDQRMDWLAQPRGITGIR